MVITTLKEYTKNSAAEVLAIIQRTDLPVVIHYWGEEETPYRDLFEEVDKDYGNEVGLYIIEIPYCDPEFKDRMPITVGYKQGKPEIVRCLPSITDIRLVRPGINYRHCDIQGVMI